LPLHKSGLQFEFFFLFVLFVILKLKGETMTQAKQGDTVNVHYTGKLEDGTVFDTSVGREPLQFTIGGSEVIPDFEQAVVGMNPGESKIVKIPHQRAYGPYREEMVLVADRDKFPQDFQPEVGQHLQLRRNDGQTFFVTVTEVSATSVTVDANHPLAGKDLTFDLELVEVV
jgi:peptidylprolyl isomerase